MDDETMTFAETCTLATDELGVLLSWQLYASTFAQYTPGREVHIHHPGMSAHLSGSFHLIIIHPKRFGLLRLGKQQKQALAN